MYSSNLSYDPLRHPSTSSSLQILTRVLETSIGPTGKLKLLENTHELTSSSQRLFHHISIKNAFSKIIVSTAKTQLRTFNDGGLFCALLTLKLVCPLVKISGRSLPLVGTLYEHFAVDFLSLLKEESSLALDFSDLRHLKSVVLTVLSSKPGCLLNRWDRDHLCSLLLKAFLDSIPNDIESMRISDCFRILTLDGLPTKESRLLKGTLVQIPETEVKTFLGELARQDGRPFKVALFTCSLAGEADWPVGGVETTSLELVIGLAIQLLDSVVSRLVLDKVNFVFCQKVVHPRMKKRLQKAGIMILDRLGSEAAKCIQYISGGECISMLSGEMSYGSISSISIEHLGKKHFLLLHSEDTPLFSIVLAHYNEEASAELKVVCRQAIDSLLRILRSPRVCFGGGCTEVHTTLLLANKVKGSLDAIKTETGCTAGQVLESLSTFQQAIANTCVSIHQGKVLDFATENAKGHLWKLHEGHFPTASHRCQCGNHDAASVDTSAWSFLSDIGRLYEVIPSTGILSDKSSMIVPPSLALTDQSLEVLDSVVQPGVALSSNPIPAFQLPTSSGSSPKCVISLNAIPNKSKPAYHLPTSVNSSPKCVLPLNATLSKSEPGCQLPTSVSSSLKCVLSSTTTSKSEPACQLPTSSGSSNKIISISNTVPSKSDPACQLFANASTSPTNISSIGLDLTSTTRSSQSTSDGSDSVILDELTCKLNSLSLAFETSALLLKTTVCINNLPI